MPTRSKIPLLRMRMPAETFFEADRDDGYYERAAADFRLDFYQRRPCGGAFLFRLFKRPPCHA